MTNRPAFFTGIKPDLFSSLTQPQVDGLNAILDAWDRFPDMNDKRQLAYCLATAYHETARTMQPIEEIGKGRNRTYGHKVKYSGQPYTTPDAVFYGRGYVQTTWFENYEKLTKANTNGWDFLNHPELCLQDGPAAWAMFYGMSSGIYTGRKLSVYINGGGCDYVNARRIINGLDCADKIAGYAVLFEKSLI